MLRRVYFSVLLFLVSCGLAAADDTAFAFAGRSFGTLNLTTGSFSAIGNFSAPIVGLGVANGELFGAGADGQLYAIDVTNASLKLVGTSPSGYQLLGSTLTGLYAYEDKYLYSVDPATGRNTRIGNGLLPSCGTSTSQLSTNSSTLYFDCAGTLYTINVAEGTATVVGSNNAGGLQIQALSSINGVLYGIKDASPPAVVTMNTATG